jgi:Undecaprenyl-phosphate glucose phosphotransferase
MALHADFGFDLSEGEKLFRVAPSARPTTTWIGPMVFGAEFAAILAISVVTGILYHELALSRLGDIETFIAVGIVAYVEFGIVLAYRGNYTAVHLTSEWRQLREVTVVWSLVCLFLVGLAFLLKIGPDLSRGATLLFFGFGWLGLAVWRFCFARYLASALERGAIAEQRVVVLGESGFSDSPIRLNELRRGGFDPVKVFPIGHLIDEVVERVAQATREDPGIRCIFMIMDWKHTERIRRVVRALSVIPLPVHLLPDGDVAGLLQNPIVRFGTLWAAELQRGPLSLAERIVKRMCDVVVAASAMVLLLPLMGFVALLIKLDSFGPVFFVQTRAGFNGRPFRIFKFRTLHALEDGPIVRQVSRNDPRLTRIGRLLRKTSVDELPQLFNVLRGEMALVGPRPHAVAHNSEYTQVIGNYAFRHHVKPGLTGWAQVNGFRGETNVQTMKRRVDFDLWYIDNWSVWLDIKIMAQTALVMLRQPSAY